MYGVEPAGAKRAKSARWTRVRNRYSHAHAHASRVALISDDNHDMGLECADGGRRFSVVGFLTAERGFTNHMAIDAAA